MANKKTEKKFKKKIFVGSSSEALDRGLAEKVGAIIDEVGMDPYLWDELVKPGDILLDRIERLPSEVHGAVLLATGDETFHRKEKNESGLRPVPNVIFEYGYLSARLTPRRVALCTFDEAKIPSDLEGVTVVKAGTYNKSGSLPRDVNEKLSRWLKRLPPLADEIPPISRVHGYSGRWEVRNNFWRWRGQEVKKPDVVYFAGDTFLLLSIECGRGYGSGTQTGKLYIKVRDYKAVYQIANRVLRATVAEDGTLNMHVEVLSRELIEEDGEPPETDYGSELFGSQEFDLELKVKSGESKQLVGRHEYWVADELYQVAEEMYTYIGI